MLNNINECGSRAAYIVSNMLQFSRKSGKKLETINTEEILEHMIDLASNDYDLKKNYDFRQIRILREYESNMRPIECVKTEIEQVHYLKILSDNPLNSFLHITTF